MSVSVVAGLGDAFEVELDGDVLHYRAWHRLGSSEQTSAIVPAPQEWAAFVGVIEKLGAFRWAGHYEPDRAPTDGVSWEIDIRYADGARVSCEGYNGYPPRDPIDDEIRFGVTPEFRRFCRAVSTLAGGLEFGWEPRQPKGSRLRVRQWVHGRPTELERQLRIDVPTLDAFLADDGAIEWLSPDPNGRELRDELWSKVGLDVSPQAAGFWPARGPVWDAAAHVHGPERTGVVLIEAKSHQAELRSPRMTSSPTPGVDDQRRKALVEAKRFYGVADDVPWTERYYQYANRLAFLYFLRERRGWPAWLVNVYFCGDAFASGQKWIVGPSDRADWSVAIQQAKDALGLPTDHPLRDYVVDLFLPVT